MIKILHILPTLDPLAGGLSQAVKNMIGYTASKEMSHEVLCLCDAEADFLKETGFPVHAMGKGVSAWSYNKQLKPWLKANISAYQHVIVHGLWQYQSYAIAGVWNKISGLRPKLHVMPHGMLDPYFQKAAGRRLKAIRNLFFWEFVEKKLVNSADSLLFTTTEEELLARNTFQRYRPKKTWIVGLGVKTPPTVAQIYDQEQKFWTGSLPDKPYWLFLGRIHPKKGVDQLVSSYLKLKGVHHDLPPLVIAGPGMETRYGKEILKLVAEDPQIVFPGMLAGNAKWTAFHGAEVFILPSHQENFGIAVVEAMACGTPVLISNKINIYKDIIKAGAGIAAPDTAEGTAHLLESWIALGDAARQKTAENAAALYQMLFTEEVASRNMIRLIAG